MSTLERLKLAPETFSDAHLLAILRDHKQPMYDLPRATTVLDAAGGDIERALEFATIDVQMIYHAAVNLHHRRRRNLPTHIHHPQDLLDLVEDMRGLPQEHMRVILLDIQHRVKHTKDTHIGTVQNLYMRVAEILRPAVAGNAPYIILVHNHPSGSAAPSGHDDEATIQIAQAAALLDIQVLEHLIVAGDDQYSYVAQQPQLLGMRHMTEEEVAQLQAA